MEDPYSNVKIKKMADVADVNIVKSRENLSNWESNTLSLAPLTSKERDTIIELTSVSRCRPFDLSLKKDKGSKPDGTDTESKNLENVVDPLSSLHFGDIKIESGQEVKKL